VAFDQLLLEYAVEPSLLRADLEAFIDQLFLQKLIDAAPLAEEPLKQA
jgi:hypothetical protein